MTVKLTNEKDSGIHYHTCDPLINWSPSYSTPLVTSYCALHRKDSLWALATNDDSTCHPNLSVISLCNPLCRYIGSVLAERFGQEEVGRGDLPAGNMWQLLQLALERRWSASLIFYGLYLCHCRQYSLLTRRGRYNTVASLKGYGLLHPFFRLAHVPLPWMTAAAFHDLSRCNFEVKYKIMYWSKCVDY